MQTIDVVLSIVKKDLISEIDYHRPGPRGYGLILIFRLLLYSVLAEKWSTRYLLKHLRKHSQVWKKLGFSSIPSRRSIDNWSKKYDRELEKFIRIVGDNYLQLSESDWTILDSTPIEDPNDIEGRKGHCSKGEIFGFKLHMSCDEKRVPLRATFTTANVSDITMAEKILAPTIFVGGDAGYDSKELKTTVWAQQSIAFFVHNPRGAGKDKKKPTSPMLKEVRPCVEQCNSIVKNQVMKNMWTNIKGFAKKATRCLLGVLATQAVAIYNLTKRGFPSLKISEVRA